MLIEKYEFTYEDYLNYCDSLYCYDSKDTLCAKEESVAYTTEESKKKTGDKKHDKIFKEILQNPKEMAQFINNFTKHKVNVDELENYTENYITKDFKYKQADIVYKIKGQEIYFLVEHQTKVDYSMPYRILNYCVEIIRRVVEEQQINNSTYRYPKVVPIVLYTGEIKWKASNSFAMSQIHKEGYEDEIIDLSYKLIDVNKYEIEALLQCKALLGNVIILEKCKNNEEVLENLKIIIKNSKSKDIEKLKRIILYLYEEIEEEIKKEIIKIFEESECEEEMSTIQERIGAEFRRNKRIARSEGRAEGLAEGLAQAIKQTIERMIKMNLEDDFIKQATGANKEEIEKIRKEVG
ncbi:MAG: Rpn family recombination-promoting nuclease/putative transposase [Clostridia bacterium]|nr:Rpn family recombination-promoting nuclease/putative transposase [Clostridia bacterium]